MRVIKDLGSLYDELNAIRGKLCFLNEMNMIYIEGVFKGEICLHQDTVYGKNLLGMDLESSFEDVLKELEKMLEKSK